MQTPGALLYCHLWPLSLSTIFFHVSLENDTIFGGKKVIEHKIVFLFSLQLLSETFIIMKRILRDIIIWSIALYGAETWTFRAM
jgi:hypothetical protein